MYLKIVALVAPAVTSLPTLRYIREANSLLSNYIYTVGVVTLAVVHESVPLTIRSLSLVESS